MRRLVVLAPHSVWPPRYGGPIRVAGLLGHLGPGWQATLFTQAIQRTDLPWPSRTVQVTDRWTEHRLRDPVSSAWIIGLGRLRYPAAYADRLLALAPRRPVRAALAAADCAMVSPHYQYPWVRRHAPRRVPVVVDAQAIERDVWRARRRGWTRRVAREVAEGERRAWRAADMVFATCEEEAEVIRAGGAARVVVVPNGVDVDRFRPAAGAGARAAARQDLGLPADAPVAVFVGSAGWSNVDALEALEAQAGEYRRRGVLLVVVGRVGLRRAAVAGVRHAGEVPDVVPWLHAADVAICPLRAGSGTSLKSVEYLAAGCALVSTPVGVRGLGVSTGVQAEVCALEEMPERVAALAADAARRDALGEAARALATRRYSWSAIGAAATAALDELVGAVPPSA